MAKTDTCSDKHVFIDNICIYCGQEEAQVSFCITLEEARVLNKLLRIHHGLFRETEEYVQILRLINGLGTFVDKHGEK